MSHYKKLFEETHIGKMKLRNRISMAPMGPVGYANSRGGFNQRLQLTGGLGRSALPGFTKKQIAPSEAENRFEPSITHREMTKDEIMNLIQKFIQSAAIAKKAGFDDVETARVCALRGHDVVLCEKSDHLGGNLIPGGVPHFKRYDLKLVDYYKRQMELQGVEVHLNTEVTADTAKSFQADIIVCASGSTPKQMTVNGELPVYTADGVVVETDGTQKVLPAKTVIASIGYKENNMLYEQLKDSEIPVYNIGDSRQVHNIMYAIWNAYELARGL